VGSSLNQRAAEFSLCNTLVLLLDLAFKQSTPNSRSIEADGEWPSDLVKVIDEHDVAVFIADYRFP
jgi:hypothetical protein